MIDEPTLRNRPYISRYGEGLGVQQIGPYRLRSGLGQLYRDWGKFDLAEANLMRAMQIRMKRFGPDHYVTSRSYDSLATLRAMQKRWPEAEQFLRKDLAIVERVRGPDHKYTAWVRVDLAETLVAQNRMAEARELLVRALPNLEHAADLQKAYQEGTELLRKTVAPAGTE